MRARIRWEAEAALLRGAWLSKGQSSTEWSFYTDPYFGVYEEYLQDGVPGILVAINEWIDLNAR